MGELRHGQEANSNCNVPHQLLEGGAGIKVSTSLIQELLELCLSPGAEVGALHSQRQRGVHSHTTPQMLHPHPCVLLRCSEKLCDPTSPHSGLSSCVRPLLLVCCQPSVACTLVDGVSAAHLFLLLLLLFTAIAGLLIDPGLHILAPWVDVPEVLPLAGHLQQVRGVRPAFAAAVRWWSPLCHGCGVEGWREKK